MNFLNPIGFVFIGLIPVLVLLYLRRVRRRAVRVPALMFWQRAMGEQPRRAWLGKLRRWLSLLVQLLILLLIMLALTRPVPKSNLAKFSDVAASTVVVIDARARMHAVEPDGQSRFAKALSAARQTVAQAREGASVAVLLAGPTPEVISSFTTDPVALGGQLATLSPTDAAGSLEATLALARKLLATRPGSHRIVLFTDSSPTEPDGGSAPAAKLETVSVGSPLDNVAITRFAARPQLGSPQTADLLLEVANFGRKPVAGNVEIRCDGTLLDVKRFELGPGVRKSQVFPAVPAARGGSGRLAARLDTHDALAVDDTAFARLPTRELCRVLLVTSGNFFLEKLLAADSALRFELLQPEAFRPEMAGQFDAVIFDDCGPRALAGVLGNALFLKSSPLVVTGSLDQPLVTDTDPESPLLRFVQWQGVNVLRAAQVKPVTVQDGWKFEMPLRSFENPLILTGTRSGGQGSAGQRLAIFTFDLADTDLPLRVAFPLLISNTLHWLAGSGLDLPESLECGQVIGLAPGEVAQQDASPRPPPVKGSLQPMRNGFYRIAGAGRERWVAVNTFNESESNLSNAVSQPGAVPSQVDARTAILSTRPLWQWFTLAALALLAGEWWLLHRRRTE